MREAADHLARNAKGDFRNDPAAERFLNYEPLESVQKKTKSPLTVDALLSLWHDTKVGVSKNTKKRYNSSFASVSVFIGDRDTNTLTGDEIYAWAIHWLNEDKVSARSIDRGDISNVKAVFAWGTSRATKSVITHNPANGIRLEEERRPKLRERTFRHKEIVAILRLASRVKADPRHPKLSAARRWCPWLAAYSGAHISELIDLRVKDVWCEAGIWVMKIDETKTLGSRLVPLHEHIIELGFVDFVRGSASGALFFDED